MKKEQKQMKKVQEEMKKTQEDILEELRVNNLKLAKVAERLETSIAENKREHQDFENRIIALERGHNIKIVKS